MSEQGTSAESAGTPAHTIMFWVLTVMSAAIFAPCVLLPIWAEEQAIHEYEQSMSAHLADLQENITKNDARIDALLSDPLVNKRIIRRELNYHAQGERRVLWTADELTALCTNFSEPERANSAVLPDTSPSWLKSFSQWLPPWPWEDLFVKSPNRSLLLLMAGGMLGAAFMLYGTTPHRSPKQR